jgi:hypothetical protein
MYAELRCYRHLDHCHIAYKEARLPAECAAILNASLLCDFVAPSNRPKQILQFEEVTGPRLPILDAEMPDRIARPVQQH